MNVLVIPEDFVKDQHMLKPIIQAMMKSLNKTAKVEICQNPRLRGVSQALNLEKLTTIIDQYKYKVDLFLLCVDRDGEVGRKQRLDNLECEITATLPNGKLFLAENAWQN